MWNVNDQHENAAFLCVIQYSGRAVPEIKSSLHASRNILSKYMTLIKHLHPAASSFCWHDEESLFPYISCWSINAPSACDFRGGWQTAYNCWIAEWLVIYCGRGEGYCFIASYHHMELASIAGVRIIHIWMFWTKWQWMLCSAWWWWTATTLPYGQRLLSHACW